MSKLKTYIPKFKTYMSIINYIIVGVLAFTIFLYLLGLLTDYWIDHNNKININNYRNDLTINIPTEYNIISYDMIEEDGELKVIINYKHDERK